LIDLALIVWKSKSNHKTQELRLDLGLTRKQRKNEKMALRMPFCSERQPAAGAGSCSLFPPLAEVRLYSSATWARE